MSTAKFEKLIDLIINEDQERAEQLFHEIVVEKSREIYESLMDEEMHEDMSEDLLDEIETEEAGMHGMMEAGEEEDEIEDMDFDTDAADMDADAADMDADAADMDMDDMGDMGGDEEAPATKGDIQDLEDKLDELIAEFEAMMGSEGEEEEEEGEEEEEEGESMVAEAIALKQVGGATYDKFAKGGDDGVNTKSPALTKPKVVQTGAGPVNFSGGGDESVPTSPKANMGYIKQGGDLISGAKNAPGSSFSEKGESTPKPVTKDAASDKRSPVAESKKSVKKVVR
jgi:hypothetical protein